MVFPSEFFYFSLVVSKQITRLKSEFYSYFESIMTSIQLSPETHNNFLKLKTTIQEMAGETVTDDQVIDFLIRSMMSSVELPEEEHEGCGCCCGGHEETEAKNHHCCREEKSDNHHCCGHHH